MSATCRKCTAPLPPFAGVGRPPTYCSTGCRRAAERELRRLDVAITKAEDEIATARRRAAIGGLSTGYVPGFEPSPHKQLKWWQGERDRLEARMRELLDDAPPTPTAPSTSTTEDA